MMLSNSNVAAQEMLKNLSQIETELAKLNKTRVEQHEATETLNKELQEAFDILVNIATFWPFEE